MKQTLPAASREPALSPEEAEVARLMAAAEADLKARRLTSPIGNNAWDRYQQVLETDPANPDAIKGMERVIEAYMELFGVAVEQEDFDKAESYLAKTGELHPDSPVLEKGEQRLQDARQARADRLAEQERQRQAEEAARQAELKRQRIAQEIQRHWESFEAAMEAENPDKATAILNQVRALDPNEPGLSAGEERLDTLQAALERQRIATAVAGYWESFELTIQEEDLDKATDILIQIRDLNPEEPGLSAGEGRLETLQVALERQEALEREYAGEMVDIPGGTFRMGNLNGGGFDDQRPVHSVTVPAFRMGRYEVTFTQWDACVADGGCGRYTPKDKGWGRGNRPVINVSWDDVQGFIDWLNDKTSGNFRLPTEAEWEYAARAGSTTQYSWGNRIGSNRANCDGCGSRWDDDRTAPVGSFPASAWGLHDMHGNVWEWVQDCYNDSYVGAPTDGRAWTSGDCGRRVIRGGAWGHDPRSLRSADRNIASRSRRYVSLGFRLAQDK